MDTYKGMISVSEMHFISRNMRSERWLGGQEHGLLFQRTQVLSLAPIGQFGSMDKSGPRRADVFFWIRGPYMTTSRCTDVHGGKTSIYVTQVSAHVLTMLIMFLA